jgi:caffeoyl-CoA O-methyltransferase
MADAPKSFFLSPELHRYLVDHASPTVDDVQRDLIAETAELGGISMMQISPEQGAFLTNLTRIVGVQHAIEVGTFTGYSSICIARGLREGGHVLCCDVSEEWTSVARRYWERAGLDDRIVLQLGPAIETLAAIPPEHQIDLAFIDADKPNYKAYYEALLPHVRRDGVILVDNTLWAGAVIDPKADDDNVRAIREFNDYVAADDRVEGSILTIGDGLTLLRKQ